MKIVTETVDFIVYIEDNDMFLVDVSEETEFLTTVETGESIEYEIEDFYMTVNIE